ncbi:hypothetical protein [Haloechinothrix sp. LS1_15]|uniref:hypothetical protein n=1 Tax=Haloechinothrix sp. LS1_15 TaxID=2652248 RepID=UPI0029482DD8|nr:hypothetical protein [Haloechinothrix sp. LS1_15]MDV6011010.1 hypothetical protein [Haloechinothrix sp. LS1_15]
MPRVEELAERWQDAEPDRGGIPPLNTTVNGSSGTCREAADWFNVVATRTESTGDWFYHARNTADSGWYGPAHEAFRDSVADVGENLNLIEDGARRSERALREFADELDKVNELMQEALDKAAYAMLEIDGPYILPPRSPGPEPRPEGFVSPSGGGIPEFQQAHDNWVGRAAQYNRHADVFEACRDLVVDARNRERQAHINLQEGLEPAGWNIDLWNVGTTTVASVLGSAAAVENDRVAALAKTNTVKATATTYQNFATGRLTELSGEARQALERSASRAGPGQQAMSKRINEFDEYTRKVDSKTRAFVAAYPGKSQLPPGSGKAASVMKNLPYAASGIVLFNQARGAYTGERTWGEAAARAGGDLGGGALGGHSATKTASILAGAPLPPQVRFVVGVGGMIAGSISGQHVVDTFMPDSEDSESPAEKYYPELPRYDY